MTTEITVQEEKKDEIVAQFHAVAVNGTEMVAAKAGMIYGSVVVNTDLTKFKQEFERKVGEE